MDALQQVSASAEAAITHINHMGGVCGRLGERLEKLTVLLKALMPYTPLDMREALHLAGRDVYNGCEELAEASADIVTDYVECLLLAQACASHLSMERDDQ